MLCKRLHLLHCYQFEIPGMLKLRFELTAKNMKSYTFFNFASIVATEKRPLSYKTPQSVNRPHYCGVQTLPLKMHYGGENWGKIGEGVVGF